MRRSQYFGELMPTKANVYLDEKEIHFVSLRLEQAFGEHHTFRVKADFDILKQDFMQNPMEHLSLIGQSIDIDIEQEGDGANGYLFSGIIQNVALEGQNGKHGYLVLTGASPTILLERGKRYDVFTNLTLKETFNQVVDEIANQHRNLPFVNNPIYTGQLEFLMQYNESDWEFLRRLSAIANENIYWTGQDLIFGAHKEFPTMETTYDKEIISFEFGNRYLPNKFTRYQYLTAKDELIFQDTLERIQDADEYVSAASERAKDLVKNRLPRTPLPLPVEDAGALSELIIREKAARASETVYVKGTAKTAHPRIGRLLTINMPETMSGASSLGTYRITKVVHTFDQIDRYHCEFEGIPSNLKAYPILEVNTPVANSILATVINNKDPDGLGRVRVEFPFAEDRASNAWLRVMSLSAGGLVGYGNTKTGVIEKNRGIVFIPEDGDQVMVGFEFGDPNRPYVMGSMFHGKNSEGGGSNNAIKSIITRSGHTIELDDAKGTLGITIKDVNENIIHIDSAKDNITITANKNVTINAGETMTLNAKNLNINVEENQTNMVGGDIKTRSANHSQDVSEASKVTIGTRLDITSGETKFVAESGDFTVQSAGVALIQGAEDARISKA